MNYEQNKVLRESDYTILYSAQLTSFTLSVTCVYLCLKMQNLNTVVQNWSVASFTGQQCGNTYSAGPD